MLKIECNERGDHVEAGGSVEDLVCEFCATIGHVYASVRKANPAAAEEFQDAMRYFMRPDAPTWDHQAAMKGASGISIVIPDGKGV